MKGSPPLAKSDHYDIAVVGAGPVGLTAALALAQHDLRVILLEAGDGPCSGSRAINISRRSQQILAAIGSITTMCMIVCCFGRQVPINFILLTIFTLCEGFMVATITARYDPKTVVTAGLATALTTISLTIYAMFTKVDI